MAGLRSYLDTLAREGDVHADTYPASADRYRDRRMPDVALVPGGLPPQPPPYVALVTLDGRTLRFGEDAIPIDAAAEVTALFRRLAGSGQVGGFGTEDFFLQSFNLLAGSQEKWSDVVDAVEAARSTGFTQVHFLVGAESEVRAPGAGSFSRRLEALAMATDRMPYERDQDLRDALAAETKDCPALAALLPRVRDSGERAEQWKQFVSKAPDVLATCECKIARGNIAAFAWHFAGRHWGPTTSTITIDIGSRRGQKLEPLRAPAAASFAEVVPKLKALPEKHAVQLTAEPSR